MKKLLVSSLIALFAVSAAAQETGQTQEPHNLKLIVRNAKGKVMRNAHVVAQVKGSGRAEELDRFGNRFFRVTDADTLIVMLGNNVYEFPVEGFDSLYVVLKNKNKVSGIAVRDKIIDTGYGTYSDYGKTTASSTVDVSSIDVVHYKDLADFLSGRVAGLMLWNGELVVRGFGAALIVVDGIPQSNFATVNASVRPEDVASISVLKDSSSAIYGVQGANGVVVIKTKTGGEKK